MWIVRGFGRSGDVLCLAALRCRRVLQIGCCDLREPLLPKAGFDMVLQFIALVVKGTGTEYRDHLVKPAIQPL